MLLLVATYHILYRVLLFIFLISSHISVVNIV